MFSTLFGISFTILEAKTVDLILHETTEHEYRVDKTISDPALYCEKIEIENIGHSPLTNFFPSNNDRKYFTKEKISQLIKNSPYPLATLYTVWKEAFTITEMSNETETVHPLDLINFNEECSRNTFESHFLRLCSLVGIRTRLANAGDRDIFDFNYAKGEWGCLDLTNEQLYVGLDNKTLISSEAIADDPFIALRAKHFGRNTSINFEKNWEQIAQFEIIEPSAAIPYRPSLKKKIDHVTGFDLYPQESLTFDPLNGTVDHRLDLSKRKTIYQSPVPILSVMNLGTNHLAIVDENIILSPGETHTFKKTIFQLELLASGNEQKVKITGKISKKIIPTLVEGNNHLELGTDKNSTTIKVSYSIDESIEKENENNLSFSIQNKSPLFDHIAPFFELNDHDAEMIWWQISNSPTFEFVPSNLDQIEPPKSVITLDTISETFINSAEPYYFRVKGSLNGQWGNWSTPFKFEAIKPLSPIEVDFEQVNGLEYDLFWERFVEDSNDIEYLIFGSNSLDFIPSIYCHKQVNGLVDGITVEEETNDNLVSITKEPKARVKGGLAYYRIIARKKGQLSVPSALIHLYDQGLIQPRNVLQMTSKNKQGLIAKRTLFPVSASSPQISLPLVSSSTIPFNEWNPIQSILRSQAQLNLFNGIAPCPSHLDPEAWVAVQDYLMPDNHPCKPKLDRLASTTRFTQNPQVMKRSGFTRGERVGRWSRVCASPHVDMQKYYFKVYCDNEIYIKYDWKRWIHRCKGARLIDECIKKNKLQSMFKVPRKWIYYLPAEPSPPNNSQYLRKDFILVCDNMRILDHSENEKNYKKKMDQKRLKGLYTILQECGLYDSVYCFNMPFNKDGYICIIDTEYWHKWPVPFSKLSKNFSSENRKFWEKITKSGKIPDGINSRENLPRNDRRDLSLVQ